MTSLPIEKLIRRIKPGLKAKGLKTVFQQLEVVDGQESITSYFWDPARLTLLQRLNKKIVLIVQQKKTKINFLIYDGRWLSDGPESFWLLKRKTITKIESLPEIRTRHIKSEFRPLTQLLELTEPTPNPQSWEELKTLVQSKSQIRKVAVWLITHFNGCIPLGAKVVFEGSGDDKKNIRAIAKNNMVMGFCEMWEIPKLVKLREKMDRQFAAQRQHLIPKDAEKLSRNNATAVTVKHGGLTLARQLRLLDAEDYSKMSEELGKTAAAVVCQFDDAWDLRHVTYSDETRTFHQELVCFDSFNNENEKNQCKEKAAAAAMQKFFERVWECRTALVARRSFLLQPLITKLEGYPDDMGSLYRNCLQQLKQTILRQMVVLHSEGGKWLQALQCYFAAFVRSGKPGARGVSVSVKMRDGQIHALCALKMTLFNMKSYVDNEKSGGDCTFYGKAWSPPASPVSCNRASLRFQTFQNQSLPKYFIRCGKTLSQFLRSFWITLGKRVMQLFGVDLHSHGAYKSLSQLSFDCVMNKAVLEDGPLHQGPERTKPFYHDLYRLSSHGGFMYTSRCRLDAGSRLHPDDENSPPAVSVSEYDLNSAYGYSGSNCRLPGGFCVGFVKPSLQIRHNEVDDWQEFNVEAPHPGESLLRADRYRHDGFEFRATYYIIDKLQQNPNDRVAHAWHNYSSLGLACIGPYPLDLMVVTELGNLKCYQFDGIYFHGCRNCSKPVHDDVEKIQKTEERDEVIQKWIAKIPGATYEVLTDCHHLTPTFLNNAYSQNPRLAAMMGCYPSCKKLTRDHFLHWVRTHRHIEDYTYVAWVTAMARKPSFMLPRPETSSGDNLLADTGSQRVALIREYFEELLDCQALEVNQLDAVLFYRTWPALGRVYQTLTQRRYMTEDPVEADFLKKVVNFSCGYMGLRESPVGRVRLVDGFPDQLNPARHQMVEDNEKNHFRHLGQNFIYLLTRPAPPKTTPEQGPCRVALPLYFFVVEHAKLRLLQFLQVIAQHVQPSDWKLLYSNIDNAVLATSAPSLSEAVRDVAARRAFEGALSTFVSEAKVPGHFKLEWCYSDASWKLVTSRIMELALVSETRDDLYRRSGPGTSDPRRGFEMACEKLQDVLSRPMFSAYRYI